MCFFLPHDAEIVTTSLSGNEHHSIGFVCPFDFHYPQHSSILIDASHPSSSSIIDKIDQLILLFSTQNSRQQKKISLIFDIIDAFNESTYDINVADSPQYGELFYVKKTKDYVNQHISKEIHLTDIANSLNISVPYMCFIFKKNVKMTIIHYVNMQKVQKLKTLIVHYGFSLKEASSLVGIDDPTYASRLFKQYEHLSIREYLKNLRNEH